MSIKSTKWTVTTAVVLAASMTLAACGSGSSTTTTTTSSTTTTVATTPLGQMQALAAAALNGQSQTFKATWSSIGSGKTTEVTLSQSPPKTYFKSGPGFDLYDGTSTYFCSSATSCIKEAGTNPIAALILLYSGQLFYNVVQGYTSAAALAAAGATLSFSNATYAGLASSCVNITQSGNVVTWCVDTATGILTYTNNSGDGSSLTLTSFTTSPPASDFVLPAGAHVSNF